MAVSVRIRERALTSQLLAHVLELRSQLARRLLTWDLG
jgi:hypothetical protein